MASSADRLAYNLKLLDALAYGKVDVVPDWRTTLTSQGHLVTDARTCEWLWTGHGAAGLPGHPDGSADGPRRNLETALGSYVEAVR